MANVESRHTEENDDSTSHYPVFTYRVRLPSGEPQDFLTDIQVRRNTYESHPPGTLTEILYDPQNPARADLKQHFTLWGWAVSSTAFVFGVLMIALFALMRVASSPCGMCRSNARTIARLLPNHDLKA